MRTLVQSPGWFVCGILACLAIPVAAAVPEHGTEFQLFKNAREEIVDYSIHRPRRQDVTAGALEGLAQQLGPRFSSFFLKQLPVDVDISAVYIATLRDIADSEIAKKDGHTLKALVERSIDGYCRSLDAYSEYADEANARRFKEAQTPDYVGIGITIRRKDDFFYCVPFPGEPADRAGVVRGDELLELDGATVRTMTLLEISARLSGLPRTAVQLKVKHSDGVAEAFRIERAAISSTPVTLIEAGGWVRIGLRRINPRAYEDLRDLLQRIGPGKPLVLDLRGCEGGDFAAAVRIAELFLPDKKLIARLESNHGPITELSRNGTPYKPGKLRLLQDGNTASGAELILAALTSYPELLPAESRGEKTYGKGVTTRPISVARGGVLTITDTRIYGPHGEFWDKVGIAPTSDAAVDAP